MVQQPHTMPHTFTLVPLRAYFVKTPLSDSAIKLIDLPADEFLDTEEAINVITASIWVLCVKYDKLAEKERPKNKDSLRRWIVKNTLRVLDSLCVKIEPPFTAWSIDMMTRDVHAVMEELLLKTI
ncbi:hypothetical protein BCR39DRAFT_32588 [Naematelia encephala]|uniref:Uncharacterized protein n=1 Tax=Naematelia encephala TaxID=71784 RepID=A0A1Y2BM75_9TREE|nr:hypothetical protein BCR39DRAFT_32588 [Naematelia encephala]